MSTGQAIPQHSTATPEHYTPIEIIDAARVTMGGDIDLDPASTATVNAKRVDARNFFTKAEDGLAREWHGRVWLNPPGGRIGNRSSAAVWWSKLADEYHAGRVTQAVFLGFSIELLATSQDAKIWPGDMPFCIPRRRIEFLKEVDGDFVKGESPTHSNVIVYLPARGGALSVSSVERDAGIARFAEAFKRFGRVRVSFNSVFYEAGS